MEQDILSTLTSQEREDLALCGITAEAQLEKCSVSAVCKDLETARGFFPERDFCLTESRIREIFQSKAADCSAESTAAEDAQFPPEQESVPTTGFKSGGDAESAAKTKIIRNRSVLMHSPVHCAHPFITVVSALATLALLVPVISTVILIYLMITDQMPEITPTVLATLILGIPCAVYLLLGGKANCPVCHMRLFTFRNYNRHRAAHYLPLLGYNFTTALHILLLWNYTCPACGTPAKFIGAKGRKSRF